MDRMRNRDFGHVDICNVHDPGSYNARGRGEEEQNQDNLKAI